MSASPLNRRAYGFMFPSSTGWPCYENPCAGAAGLRWIIPVDLASGLWRMKIMGGSIGVPGPEQAVALGRLTDILKA